MPLVCFGASGGSKRKRALFFHLFCLARGGVAGRGLKKARPQNRHRRKCPTARRPSKSLPRAKAISRGTDGKIGRPTPLRDPFERLTCACCCAGTFPLCVFLLISACLFSGSGPPTRLFGVVIVAFASGQSSACGFADASLQMLRSLARRQHSASKTSRRALNGKKRARSASWKGNGGAASKTCGQPVTARALAGRNTERELERSFGEQRPENKKSGDQICQMTGDCVWRLSDQDQ